MHSRILLPVVSACLVLIVTAPAASSRTLNGVEIHTGEWRGEPIEYLEGEILVGLQKGQTEADFLAQLGDTPVDIVRHADRFGFLKLRAENPADLFDLIGRVEGLASVRYAEPNMVDRMFVTPNDPDFVKQWHYHNTGQSPPSGTPDADIDCPEAWDISTGTDAVIVGVLDSGIPMQGGQLSHPDLDDPTRYLIGTDIINGDSEPMDENGHGTHVSGTIAAETDNGIGVAGVSWNAKVMAIQVFDRFGSGSHEAFRDGCIFGVDNGCLVLNYSGGGSAGATKEHGVAYADTHGVVLCAAAGNANQGAVSWPGAYSLNYSNTICVSATNHHDASSGFSSIGPEVTICAPGGHGSPFDSDDIWSTFPNYEFQIGLDYGLAQNYGPLAGTSMATPHVAGLCALIRGMDPSIPPDSVRQLLINTSDDLGPTGFDNQFGWGRINAHSALSQMRGVSIGHTPLPDTKDSLNPYEVICTIFSDTVLDPALLLMRYEIAATPYEEILLPTGGAREYHAFIPAQAPGTVIDYYLLAENERGDADTTGLFSFRVIDYGVLVDPVFSANTGAVDDTVWYPITVTNNGVYDDQFALTLLSSVWATRIWDAAGIVEITSLGPLAPDAAEVFLVSVEVPASLYGDYDSVAVQISSMSSAGVEGYAMIRTTSAGEPLPVPFLDEFPAPSVDVGKWVEQSGVAVNGDGLAEPTEPYALNFDGDPSGGDYLISQAIDMGGLSGINISYAYQQTGGGESPDAGDDLFVDYMNNSGVWTLLNTHLGDGGDMTKFEIATIGAPLDAYHSGFRLRFRNTATAGDYDDWYVDDVRVDWGPSISAWPFSFSHMVNEGDSTFDELIIENGGPGTLAYSLKVLPDLSPAVLDALARPADDCLPVFDHGWADGTTPPPLVKGGYEGEPGRDVLYGAGGPDNFGYVWVDSDEPGGPSFAWVDVLPTGTDITGGLTDDNFVGPFPIGFTFPFYDGNYTEFYVSSNGFIGFGPTGGYTFLSNVSIPGTATPNNIIAWCWDDLNPVDSDNPGARVVYDNVGGTLVIQYEDYPEYAAAPGDVIDFEMILHPDGRIVLQYGDIASGFDLLSATVGIENGAGDDGLQVVYNAAYLHDSLVVEVLKPAQWLTFASTSGSVAPGGADTISVQFGFADLDSGFYKANIEIRSNDPDPGEDRILIPADLSVGGCDCPKQGDVAPIAGNGIIDVFDVVTMVQYTFREGPSLPECATLPGADRGNWNCDLVVDVLDVVSVVDFAYRDSGIPPCDPCQCAPYPDNCPPWP